MDANGNAYIAGSTEDLDFPVTSGALQTQNISQLVSGDLASFVTKVNPTASAILYSTFLTGTGDQSGDQAGISCDCAEGIALDNAQNLYVAGRTVSTDFPTTISSFQNQSGSGSSAFVTKFDAAEMEQFPVTTTTVKATPNPQTYGQPITFTATIEPTSGTTPTGTVGFSYQGLLAHGTPYAFGPWNVVPVSGAGVAQFTTNALASGSIGVVAYYLGDTKNAPSDGGMTETVNKIPTSTTITANTSSAPYGTPIIFTATVVEAASGKSAQGIVFFDQGSLSYESATLNSAGQATWTNGTGGPSLAVGSEQITAEFLTYAGEADASSQGSVTVNITAVGVAATPTFSPPAGTYSSTQSVTLSSTTSGSTIYYTTDGSTPTAGSSVYVVGLPIQVNASQTIRAIAIAPGDTASSIASATYVISVLPPGFSISGTAVSVIPGATTGNTSTISVSPVGGFVGNVTLTASIISSPVGAQYLPTLSFGSASTVNLAGIAANTAVLTVSTTAPTSAILAYPKRSGVNAFAAEGGALASILLIGIRLRRTSWRSILGIVALLAAVVGGLGACGGGGSGGGGNGTSVSGTTAGNYVITVVGTSSSSTASGTLSLTVQ